jgi:hypothetical protein
MDPATERSKSALKAFLGLAPHHVAAARARAELARLR